MSIDARLRRLEQRLGWRQMTLRDGDGRAVIVPAVPIVDAYLHLMGTGTLEGSGLEPALVRALASIPARASMSDMEAQVVVGARRLLDVPSGIAPRSPDNPPEGEIVD